MLIRLVERLAARFMSQHRTSSGSSAGPASTLGRTASYSSSTGAPSTYGSGSGVGAVAGGSVAPPAYTPPTSAAAAPLAGKRAPPPPPGRPGAQKEYATALYDYAATVRRKLSPSSARASWVGAAGRSHRRAAAARPSPRYGRSREQTADALLHLARRPTATSRSTPASVSRSSSAPNLPTTGGSAGARTAARATSPRATCRRRSRSPSLHVCVHCRLELCERWNEKSLCSVTLRERGARRGGSRAVTSRSSDRQRAASGRSRYAERLRALVQRRCRS